MLLEERHDLVISDVMMPGISGLDLCRRVKDDPRTQAVPVLLLTARDATEHRIEGHGVEADEYLTKPFDPAELFAAVAGLLAGRTRRAEVASRRRSESLRTLLGGMAHELRNATHQMRSAQAVMLALTRRAVEAEGATDAERRKRLEKLERMEGVMGRSLSRVTRVVSGIGHYAAGRMRDRWVVIDLDELVHREVSVLAPSLEGDVTLTTELAAGARIQGPEEEVRMTVINLVENAVKAVRGGGSVQVRTAERRGRVLLEVRDDGSGIPPERLESIFEPFFTTRDPGEGMGLGLALVKRVVEDVGGRISVHSRPGEGSLFTVSIPVYDAGGAAARGGGGGSGVRDKGEDDDYNDGLSEKAAET
jgi:signal transduction histidine kinase